MRSFKEHLQLLREPEILDRLVQQLMDKGKSKDAAYAIATASLQKNGVLKPGTQQLTAKGEKRNSMSAGERAKDRAAKKDGNKPEEYSYNKKTNLATKKEDRDYKREYQTFHGKPQERRRRSLRVLARREMEKRGRVSKGDGKDVDHRKPLSKGGTNAISNLKIVDKSSNRSKKNT